MLFHCFPLFLVKDPESYKGQQKALIMNLIMSIRCLLQNQGRFFGDEKVELKATGQLQTEQ